MAPGVAGLGPTVHQAASSPAVRDSAVVEGQGRPAPRWEQSPQGRVGSLRYGAAAQFQEGPCVGRDARWCSGLCSELRLAILTVTGDVSQGLPWTLPIPRRARTARWPPPRRSPEPHWPAHQLLVALSMVLRVVLSVVLPPMALTRTPRSMLRCCTGAATCLAGTGGASGCGTPSPVTGLLVSLSETVPGLDAAWIPLESGVGRVEEGLLGGRCWGWGRRGSSPAC